MRMTIFALAVAAFCVGTQTLAANPLTVAVDTKPALSLQLPDNWSAKSKDGVTTIKAGKYEVHVQLWPVAKAKSVQEAMPMVAELIKGEVSDFKAGKAGNLTVAGGAAKHIVGTGTEADDGDPSNVEVYLFSVGGKVFLLCAHGEGHGAANARGDITKVLSTTAKP